MPPAHLIRLHRHSLTNVVVIGGTAERREQVARSFHRESPLRDAALVVADGSAREDELHRALEAWTGGAGAGEANALSGAEHGTLFIDQVEKLSPETQQLLLALGRRLLGEPEQGREVPCPGRIVVGNPHGLARAVSEGTFLAALYEVLDKVRVELEVPAPGEAS